MKKLGKLRILSEKIMKNEELINLQGGYGSEGWCCLCLKKGGGLEFIHGVESEYQCWIDCRDAFEGYPDWVC